MKRVVVTIALWLAVAALTFYLTTRAYEELYYPFVLGWNRGSANGHGRLPIYLLLGAEFLLHVLAGAMVAWRIEDRRFTLVAAMAIGLLSVAWSLTLPFPWFLLLPDHVAPYDRLMAIAGVVNRPLAATLGAYALLRWRGLWEVSRGAT